MTTYRAISDSEFAADEGVKTSIAEAWTKNVIAITEGASGAPKIQSAAIAVDAANQAIARDSGAGDVGTYAFLQSSTDPHNFGDTEAAANLTPAGIIREYNTTLDTYQFIVDVPASSSLSGTWQCMGYASSTGTGPATLWLRVL